MLISGNAVSFLLMKMRKQPIFAHIIITDKTALFEP
jgi:hypothetical protein